MLRVNVIFKFLFATLCYSVRISYESRDPGMRGAGNGMASRPVSRKSRSRYPGRDRTLIFFSVLFREVVKETEDDILSCGRLSNEEMDTLRIESGV